VRVLTSNTRSARQQRAVKGIGAICAAASTLLSRKLGVTALKFARRRFNYMWMA
jgi:hypothetical protein